MATKFEARIIGRLLDRLAKGGLDAALEYGVAVCGGNPQIAKFVLANAPKPLKIQLQASFAARKSKKQFAHAEMVAQRAADLQARNLVIEAFVADFQGARRIGQAAVFLAGLTMAERDLCKATKQEVAAAVVMPRNCVRSTRAKEILQCTDTELARWSEDGRLPIMFRRRMPSSVGVTLSVRHWDIALIQEASLHLAQWREDDAQAKRRKRSEK